MVRKLFSIKIKYSSTIPNEESVDLTLLHGNIFPFSSLSDPGTIWNEYDNKEKTLQII
jgi:hypothetical protein